MAAAVAFTEGFAQFKAPSTGGIACETYYKIAGSLTDGKRPLVILHGGPGSTHDYARDTYHGLRQVGIDDRALGRLLQRTTP